MLYATTARIRTTNLTKEVFISVKQTYDKRSKRFSDPEMGWPAGQPSSRTGRRKYHCSDESFVNDRPATGLYSLTFHPHAICAQSCIKRYNLKSTKLTCHVEYVRLDEV